GTNVRVSAVKVKPELKNGRNSVGDPEEPAKKLTERGDRKKALLSMPMVCSSSHHQPKLSRPPERMPPPTVLSPKRTTVFGWPSAPGIASLGEPVVTSAGSAWP